MNDPDHILVVDDDSENRHLLEQYLEKNGCRVSAVGDGSRTRPDRGTSVRKRPEA